MNVHILTFVREMDRLGSGGTLVFKTLRKGFPTADITITDNASIPEARKIIKKLAEENGCKYVQLEEEIKHHAHIREVIYSSEGTAVFVDADVMFWDEVENWDFSKYLMAGRFIPMYYENLTGCQTMPRIHPSLFWVSDCEELTNQIREKQKEYWDYEPFHEYVFTINETWYRYDTISTLTNSFLKYIYYFRENELNCYDHLLAGGWDVEEVCESLPEIAKRNYKRHRDYIKDDRYTNLKGIWKEQDKFFQLMK